MNLSIQEKKTPAGVPEKPKEVPKVGELWRPFTVSVLFLAHLLSCDSHSCSSHTFNVSSVCLPTSQHPINILLFYYGLFLILLVFLGLVH